MIALPRIEPFSVSVTVIVCLPFFFNLRLVKVCTPWSAAVNTSNLFLLSEQASFCRWSSPENKWTIYWRKTGKGVGIYWPARRKLSIAPWPRNGTKSYSTNQTSAAWRSSSVRPPVASPAAISTFKAAYYQWATAHPDLAQSLPARKEREAARQIEGMVNPFEGHQNRLLALHLDDFEMFLRNATNKRGCKNTECHVRLTVRRARRVMDGCRFLSIAEISADKVEAYITRLGTEEGLSIQSCNFYLAASKQFCRWLVDRERIDPAGSVEARQRSP
jgi:hypothetical protein